MVSYFTYCRMVQVLTCFQVQVVPAVQEDPVVQVDLPQVVLEAHTVVAQVDPRDQVVMTSMVAHKEAQGKWTDASLNHWALKMPKTV